MLGQRLWMPFLVIVGGSMLGIAADWPTYLHDVQRQAASGETFLSPTNAGQLTPLWSYQTGGWSGHRRPW